MLTRYFTAIGAFILIALVIRNLLTRQQQRVLHGLVTVFAKILLAVSALSALLAFLFRG